MNRDSILDLRLWTSWKRGPADGSPGPVLISYTEFAPHTLRDLVWVAHAAPFGPKPKGPGVIEQTITEAMRSRLVNAVQPQSTAGSPFSHRLGVVRRGDLWPPAIRSEGSNNGRCRASFRRVAASHAGEHPL